MKIEYSIVEGPKRQAILRLTEQDFDYSEYYETKRLFGFVPYDVPKMPRPSAYESFLRVGLHCVFEFISPGYLCVYELKRSCDRDTISRLQHYALSQELEYQESARMIVVALPEVDQATNLALSAALDQRRIMQAFGTGHHLHDIFSSLDRLPARRLRRCQGIKMWCNLHLEKPLVKVIFGQCQIHRMQGILASQLAR
jgi:hypothetical protein